RIPRAFPRATGVKPNNAFKPTPLRSTNHMAGTACHVVCLNRPVFRRHLAAIIHGSSRSVHEQQAVHGVKRHPDLRISATPILAPSHLTLPAVDGPADAHLAPSPRRTQPRAVGE